MLSQKKFDKVMIEILTALYAKASPKLDLKKAMKSGYTKKEGWMAKHVLSDDKQDEIIAKIFRKHKISKTEGRSFAFEIFNYSPTFGKTVKK